MSAICAGLGSKGKVGVQRGRETVGVPSFLPPRRAPRRSRRPQTANPSLRFSEKLPARKGRTRLRQFACPGQLVQKRSRPSGANTLTQFECPAGSVQKRRCPERANTLTQFAHPGFPVQKRSRPLGANTLTQFAYPVGSVQKIREIPKKFSRPKRRQKRPFSR